MVPLGKTLFRTADLAKLAAAKGITRPLQPYIPGQPHTELTFNIHRQ
jgi:hypothetical protein